MKKDLSGKSLALFVTKNLKNVSSKQISNLKKISKINNSDSRICLHKRNSIGPQIMIINKIKKKKDLFNFYKHKFDKLFMIIEGKIIISFNKKKIILARDKDHMLILKKNISSSTFSYSKNSVYLEIIFRK